MPLSLKARLAVPIILLLLFVGVGSVLLSAQYFRNKLTAHVDAELQYDMNITMHALEHFVGELVQASYVFVTDPVVTSPLVGAGSRDEAQDEIAGFVAASPLVSSSVLMDVSGQVVIASAESGMPWVPDVAFQQRVIQSGRAMILASLEYEHARYVAVVQPIRNAEGEIIGLSASTAPFALFSDNLGVLASDSAVVLIDESGRIVLHTRSSDAIGLDAHHEEALAPIADAVVAGKDQGQLQTHDAAGSYTALYFPFEGMTVAVLFSSKEAYALVGDVIKLQIVAGFISLVVLAGMAWMIIGASIKDISTITMIARAISSDNLHVPMPQWLLEGDNEVSVLARTLSDMEQRLSVMKESLEKQVQERSAAVEEARARMETKVKELEKINKLMVGRELEMVALKKAAREKSSDVPDTHVSA